MPNAEAKIRKLGKIIGVWAHPDDETWSMAGIMRLAINNGQGVVCVNATRGEQGVQDEKRWPKSDLAQIRQKELKNSLRIIGKGKIVHYWLPYKDGECHDVSIEDARDRLIKIMKEEKPDTVLTFGPDGLTGHSDHKTVSKWVKYTIIKLDNRPNVYHVCESRRHYNRIGKKLDQKNNIYFNIDEPPLKSERDMDICLRLDDKLIQVKLKALKAQKSQTDSMFSNSSEEDIRQMVRLECFCRAPENS